MKPLTYQRQGVTLLEMLVALSIAMILLGLLINAVMTVRDRVNRVSCANHLRQIGLAFHGLHHQHGSFPPILSCEPPWVNRSHIDLAWTHFLLPYIDQEPLWHQTLQAMHSSLSMRQDPPHVGLRTVVLVYTCPQDGRLARPITDDRGCTAAYGSFLVVAGGDYGESAMDWRRGVSLAEVLDGASNTLLVGERPPAGRLLAGSWYSPNQWANTVPPDPNYIPGGMTGLAVVYNEETYNCSGPVHFGPGRIDNRCDSDHFWSLHRGGAHFLMVDGGTRFIPYSAKDLLPALATRAGGDVSQLP